MEPWPPKLDIVEPKNSVSVTVASMANACLLSDHVPRSVVDGWPTSLRARVGTIVHDSLEKLASQPHVRRHLIDDEDARREFLQAALRSEGINLQYIGDAWGPSVRTFERALCEMPEWLASRQVAGDVYTTAALPEEYVSQSPTEGWVVDSRLGIHGKFDLRIESGDEILIDDYKTSCVGGDKEKLEKWIRQVSIYALISWRAMPDKLHRARIIASDGVFDVSCSEQSLRLLEDELMRRKTAWPTSPEKAEGLATVCLNCRSCRARHVCPAYLSRTPWLEDEEMDHPDDPVWSWDVWGTVKRISNLGPRHGLVLQTEKGLRVIANGFDPSSGIDQLSIGDNVGVFGLRKDRGYTSSRPVFRVPMPSVNSSPPRVFLRVSSPDSFTS